MNIIKHIFYVNLLVVSCNAFGMLGMSQPAKLSGNRQHPQIQKIVNPKTAHPVIINCVYPVKNIPVSAESAKRILNFTSPLSNKKHEQFKNYFDEQTINNSTEYKNLLAGRSDNQEVQELLDQAKMKRNPHTKKITTPANTKGMCPQISLEKLTTLKTQHIKEQLRAELQQQLNRKKENRQKTSSARIKMHYTYQPSPKHSPTKISPKGSPEKRHLCVSL
jgi:hypothetical protein